jgi:hypothetical protein
MRLEPETLRFVASSANHWATISIPVNPPPLHRSLPRKSLIYRMDWVSWAGDINLPHDLPPTTKFSPDFEGPFRPSRQLSKSSAREQNQIQ